MPGAEIHAVTGAYGYSGKYIARRLLDRGKRVITLTNSPERENPFGRQVPAYRFHFDQPERLIESLKGVAVLYNTYWVRFNHGDFTFENAVRNSRSLFQAAREAGVQRIVHVSITNPSLDSRLEYFSGKARVEQALAESGVPHSILRPAVLFGKEDILINNIAWVLRRLPVFGVFGDGQYRLQPIYVDDLAKLAVEQGQQSGDAVIDAIGPETYTFRSLVEEIGRAVGHPRPEISVPPRLGYWAAVLLGWAKRDVLLTWEEVQGLMQGLLYVDSPPTGETRLSEWMRENKASLGYKYASELARRRNRKKRYGS